MATEVSEFGFEHRDEDLGFDLRPCALPAPSPTVATLAQHQKDDEVVHLKILASFS